MPTTRLEDSSPIIRTDWTDAEIDAAIAHMASVIPPVTSTGAPSTLFGSHERQPAPSPTRGASPPSGETVSTGGALPRRVVRVPRRIERETQAIDGNRYRVWLAARELTTSQGGSGIVTVADLAKALGIATRIGKSRLRRILRGAPRWLRPCGDDRYCVQSPRKVAGLPRARRLATTELVDPPLESAREFRRYRTRRRATHTPGMIGLQALADARGISVASAKRAVRDLERVHNELVTPWAYSMPEDAREKLHELRVRDRGKGRYWFLRHEGDRYHVRRKLPNTYPGKARGDVRQRKAFPFERTAIKGLWQMKQGRAA